MSDARATWSAGFGARNCPVCGGSARSVGPVFHGEPSLVAGVPIDLSSIGPFALAACGACGFQFKDPPIPQAALLDCYRRADAGNWEVDPDPHHRQFDVLCWMLEGATAHVRGRKRDRCVYIGGNFVQIYQGEPCFSDILKMLEPMGITRFSLYDLENLMGRLGWGDAIFVQPELPCGLGPKFGLATHWSGS